jgi:hypothetical protein
MTMTRRATLAATAAAAALSGLALASTTAESQERHPKIREAIRAIRGAQDDLRHAAHDFGGHREDALRDCDRAAEQLETCLKYPG